jgi:hypothetical protein
MILINGGWRRFSRSVDNGVSGQTFLRGTGCRR